MLYLRPYQEKGAQFLAANPRAYLGDVMGLGKGGQSASAAVELGVDKLLWIAPAATLPGLVDEIQRWGGPKAIVLDSSGYVEIPDTGWCLVAWTSLWNRKRCLLKTRQWQVVICDEAQRAKNPNAKMTRVALGRIMKRKDGKICRTRCLATHTERMWFLSGTPIMNRPIDLQQVLFLGLNQGWAIRQEYGDRYCLRDNPRDPRGYDFDGARNLAELAGRLSETGLFLRRTPEDVPGELPEVLTQVVSLDASDAPCELSVKDVKAALGRGVPPPFEECSAYRRAAGLRKVEACARWIKEALESEEALVVFGWHPEVLERIRAEVGEPGALVCGGTPVEARKKVVDEFSQRGGPRVFYGTIGACGVGINGLHRRTSVCVFAESSWVPADMEQAIGRVRRIGGVGSTVRAYILCARESLESYVMQVVAKKIAVAGTVLAGISGDTAWLQ